MAQTVPNLCVSRKVFLKHQVNWNAVCGAMQDLPWRDIWSADNPVEALNEHLTSTLLWALTHWECFLFFLRELLMFWPHVLV